jgi:hypothetical protein
MVGDTSEEHCDSEKVKEAESAMTSLAQADVLVKVLS